MIEENIVLNNIQYTIEHLKVPDHWMYDGVEPPNALAKTMLVIVVVVYTQNCNLYV